MNNQEKIEILKKDIKYRRVTIIIQMIFGLSMYQNASTWLRHYDCGYRCI